MARFSKQEADDKRKKARDLFLKNVEIDRIAEFTGVSDRSIREWVKDGKWQEEKELRRFTPTDLQNLILKAAATLAEGKTPDVSPDDLSKLASSYDKLSEGNKSVVHAIDAFDGFIDWLLSRKLATKKETDDILKLVKSVAPYFDAYVQYLIELNRIKL